jgi:hypothetical protein
MSVLKHTARKALKPSDFALPPNGYPIEDMSHARNADARAAQEYKAGKLSKKDEQTVFSKVHSRYPSIRQNGPMA